MGAGFDVRAISCYLPNIRFFEIDCKVVHKLKIHTCRLRKVNTNATFISIDYIKDRLIHSLKDKSVNFDAPTLFIYEGNSMYSSKSDINVLFRNIGENFKMFYVVLDYLSDNFIQQKTGVPENSLIMKNNESIGAPLINGYSNIDNFAIPNGLKLIQHFTFEELAFKYGVHDDKSIPEMRDYSIAYAVKNMC